MTRSWNSVLLGVGMIVLGCAALLGVTIPAVVIAVWLIVTGVFILLGR